jgi:hypothetical protein
MSILTQNSRCRDSHLKQGPSRMQSGDVVRSFVTLSACWECTCPGTQCVKLFSTVSVFSGIYCLPTTFSVRKTMISSVEKCSVG